MTKAKWIIGALVALVVILGACAAPYFFIGAPAEGIVKVRKGSTIDMIADSVKAHVDETFGKRVATMMNLMNAKVENREGAFRITKGMPPFNAARRIKNGVQDGIRFTFNNVRTLDEWTDRWGETFMDGPDGMRKALKDSTLCAKYGKTPQTIACLLMPDTYEFYWTITPEKMLDRMNDYYNDFWTSERKAKVTEIMKRMAISHRAQHFPQQLSGGQQQRVAIARAVVAGPKLILADEPTGNLDSKNGKEVMDLLKELNAEGTTIVMVTHSQKDAAQAQRTIDLFDGQIVSDVKNEL